MFFNQIKFVCGTLMYNDKGWLWETCFSETSVLHMNTLQFLLTAGSEFRMVILASIGVVFVLTFSIALPTQEKGHNIVLLGLVIVAKLLTHLLTINSILSLFTFNLCHEIGNINHKPSIWRSALHFDFPFGEQCISQHAFRQGVN